MPINLTCSCGRLQRVAKTLAGQTLNCASCGKAIAVPSMDVLRRRKAEAHVSTASLEEPEVRHNSRRVLVMAVAGLVLLCGAVLCIGWLASKERRQPQQVTQAEPLRSVAPSTEDHLLRQPQSDETKPTEPPKPEPARVPTPPAPETPTSVLPTKAIPVDLPELVRPPQPKEKDPPPVEVKKPFKGPELVGLVWKLKESETFFQEVIVTQKPSFSILGVPAQLLLQYQVVSRFTVQKANEDGSLVVQQKVETIKLLQADELTQAALAGAVAQLPGTSYTLHLSPKMEITQFQGGAVEKPGLMQFAGGKGLQMASLVDRDGWKELAQMTFFQMDEPLKAKARWSKPLTHSWGALGSWSGEIHYAYLGQQKDVHKISYGLQLKYKAPAADAVLAGMQVSGANFQPQEAGGYLLFDAARGKVVAAEERFRVKGVMNAKLLGQPTPIEMEEDQHFLIRIHEKKVP